jgi:hypothetical protein
VGAAVRFSFSEQWPYLLGATGAAGFLALLITRREPIGVGTSAVEPSSPDAAPPPPAGRGRITSDPVVAHNGMTYFAAVETNGVVSSAANVNRIKVRAESEGFHDVAVFKLGDKPPEWPVAALGDYVVRGTFGQAAPKAFDRHVSVFAGSVNLLDVFEA